MSPIFAIWSNRCEVEEPHLCSGLPTKMLLSWSRQANRGSGGAGSSRRMILCFDSSAYLALLNRADQHHNEAVRVLRALARKQSLQGTTDVVLIEAHTLVLSRLGIPHGQAFLRDMERSATTVVRELGDPPDELTRPETA